MSFTAAKFNVEGTIFEVDVAKIQYMPEGLLAQMLVGKIQCGQDASGAFLVDRNLSFFDFAHDENWEGKEHLLVPGVIRERVLDELYLYYLQDSPRSLEM